jgi:uncharacterized membrane protein
MLTYQIILLASGFLLALVTGLLYAYSCSVNKGLGQLPDSEYLHAMQLINRAILNPWFFTSFLGTLIMLPLSVWMAYRNDTGSLTFYLILIATFIYWIGVFGVTVFGNVPLNGILDRYDIGPATASELKVMRTKFEMPWNSLHLLRTIASQVCLLLILIAMITKR